MYETSQRVFTRCACAQRTGFLIKEFNQESVSVLDDAAAQHLVPVVQHHRLSGGDGPLGPVKDHLHAPVRQGGHGGLGLRLAVSGFGGDPDGARRGGPGDPVHPAGGEAAGEHKKEEAKWKAESAEATEPEEEPSETELEEAESAESETDEEPELKETETEEEPTESEAD